MYSERGVLRTTSWKTDSEVFWRTDPDYDHGDFTGNYEGSPISPLQAYQLWREVLGAFCDHHSSQCKEAPFGCGVEVFRVVLGYGKGSEEPLTLDFFPLIPFHPSAGGGFIHLLEKLEEDLGDPPMSFKQLFRSCLSAVKLSKEVIRDINIHCSRFGGRTGGPVPVDRFRPSG